MGFTKLDSGKPHGKPCDLCRCSLLFGSMEFVLWVVSREGENEGRPSESIAVG